MPGPAFHVCKCGKIMKGPSKMNKYHHFLTEEKEKCHPVCLLSHPKLPWCNIGDAGGSEIAIVHYVFW